MTTRNQHEIIIFYLCTYPEKLLLLLRANAVMEMKKKTVKNSSLKARLQPFTVLFSFSAILVCFIDAQIHSCFREKMSGFERQ